MLKRLLPRRDRIFAMLDQAMTGGGNMLTLAVCARLLSKDAFGALGAAIALHFVIFGFHRANIVLPYMLGGKDEVRAHPESGWFWLALWASALVAALLFAASGIAQAVAGPGFVPQLILFAAIQSPCLLMQEFGKRWLYQNDKSGSVAISSFCGFVAIGMGLGALAWFQWPPVMASVVLGAGALVSVAAAALRRPPVPAMPFGPFLPMLKPRARFGLWQSLTHIPYVIYNNGFPLILAALGGPVMTAGFTALRTLLTPSVSLISAVDSTDKIRAVNAFRKSGVWGAKRSVDKTRLFLIGLNGPFLLVVCLFAEPLQHLIIPKYVLPRETWILAAYFLLLTINQPYETFLIVQERAKVLFVSRCLSAAIALGGVLVLGRAAGLAGAATALALAQAVNLLALWLLSRRELKQAGPEPQPSAA